MDIRQITFRDIPPEIVADGKISRLIFRDGPGVLYFGGYLDGRLVTLACLVVHKNGNATIKSNYTLKGHRGRGHFTELLGHVLGHARALGVKTISLNCLKDSVGIHAKAGARLWKTTKTIYWLVYDEGF